MKINSITTEQVIEIANRLDLVVSNIRATSKSVTVKLNAPHSDHRYARKSWSGRRLNACSFEAFRDFIGLCFLAGATRVTSASGAWASLQEFAESLEALRYQNIGSRMQPAYMGELSNEDVPCVWDNRELAS